MSIISSAITPHSPVLIPPIGKEAAAILEKTRDAFKKLEQEFYVREIDTIVVISPHGIIQDSAFTINLHPFFRINFEEFGDYYTRKEVKGDIALAAKLRENIKDKFDVELISYENLDYGTSVPLFFCLEHLKNIKVVPIYYSNLDLQNHFNFGKALQKELSESRKRIAVIASGDLSHILKDKKVSKFDQKLVDIINNSEDKFGDILKLDKDLIDNSHQCALRSVTVLLGVLDGLGYQTETLSYQNDLGVGYLVTHFVI